MQKHLTISALVLVFLGFGLFFYADHQQKEYLQSLKQLSSSNTYWDDIEQRIDKEYSVNPLLKSFLRANMKVELDRKYEVKASEDHHYEVYIAVAMVMIGCGGITLLLFGVHRLARYVISAVNSIWVRYFTKQVATGFVEVKPQPQKLLEPETVEKESVLDEEFREQKNPEQWKEKKRYYSTMKTIYNPEKQTSGSMVKAMQDKTTNLEQMIKNQFDSLQKQILEVREVTGGTQSETADPAYDETLAQLTRQVAAMNEFTSKQQEKVKKLQEGYDWNIVKNFALKVIRCLDNLENTIERLSDADEDTATLEETRDDFIFALESSGIEQFVPEKNSEYRGQERYAEAVSKREVTPEAALKGKIAKIIRPGYKFVIDDQKSRIVRTAQVKLYG